MSSIIIDLQKDALNKDVSVTDLLREAYVVARKLKITEFEKWIQLELKGYSKTDDIPDYRLIEGKVKARNPNHGWQPVLFPDKELEEAFSKRSISQTISELESLLAKEKSGSGLQVPFSAVDENNLRKAIGFDMPITLTISFTSLVRIIDAVRSIILNWSLKLEEDGILGEGLKFTSKEKKVVNNASYNITDFYALVQNSQVQQGKTESTQLSNIQNIDLQQLNEFLLDIQSNLNVLEMSDELRNELIDELKVIDEQTKIPSPENSIILKSLNSIKRILEGAGGGIVSHLQLQLSSLLDI